MSITVTVDEMRAFQKEMESWFTLGARFYGQLLRHAYLEDRISFLGHGDALNRVDAELAKWDTEHPMPKLIPSV